MLAHVYPKWIHLFMFEIQETGQFSRWLSKLKDKKAKGIIIVKISKLALGDFVDQKYVGNKISEMRIHVGPGYRVYFSIQNDKIIVLLCGGSKSSQKSDIKKAGKILKYWI